VSRTPGRQRRLVRYAPGAMAPSGAPETARQPFPPAEAGVLLVTLTLVAIGIGAAIGWAAGSVGIGVLVGAVLGVPAGVFAVYRRYRGAFS
jgi:F0F1-type ATP synthase assembly protein I